MAHIELVWPTWWHTPLQGFIDLAGQLAVRCSSRKSRGCPESTVKTKGCWISRQSPETIREFGMVKRIVENHIDSGEIWTW